MSSNALQLKETQENRKMLRTPTKLNRSVFGGSNNVTDQLQNDRNGNIRMMTHLNKVKDSSVL